MNDVWFEIADLPPEVHALVPDATHQATYSAGPALAEQTGAVAALWLGFFNSSLNGGPIHRMEEIANAAAPLLLGWLLDHDLAADGTVIEIAFADRAAAGPFLSQNVLETFRFAVSAGELSRGQAATTGRRLRYLFSGREVPKE